MVRIFLPLTSPAKGEGGEGEKNAGRIPLPPRVTWVAEFWLVPSASEASSRLIPPDA